MKILIISSNYLCEFSGGGLGLRKIIEGLNNIDFIDEIGLINREEINTSKCPIFFHKLKKIYFFKNNKFINLKSKIYGEATFLNLYWEKIKKIIDEYDILFFQGTRFGSIVKNVKSIFRNKKIIVQVENFEYKYSKIYYNNKFFLKIIQPIEMLNVKKNEYLSLYYSDIILFLTKLDRDEIIQFYSLDKELLFKEKSFIVPHAQKQKVSLKKIEVNLHKKIKNIIYNKELRILFTGSFDYKPNIEAANFLLKVFNKIPNINKKYKFILIFAGRNANKLNIKKSKNIEIYNNLNDEEMSKIFLSSDIYISPVFKGSGMKTKIAEAMSYGLPILSSYHSIIGYDYIIENLKNINFIKLFNDNDIEDFLDNFSFLLNLIENNYAELSYEAYNTFSEKYSIEYFSENLKRILDTLIYNKEMNE
ncbi:glycosyltransferase [Marinitoga piezophila KA3]|uniref:Glycosyltransferase n=1 Tax=Marinitoga piezophila (strain DSM 14283 / JCM 11233 / KA3) TaxID=443254 RepID=H2J8F1_MARPK|nr:glycosyltransferase family 4 protein [Marinitoga piezophila]AEX85635.1 glycosyltransferase [Marinitoga piezophila KA3]